ncbi:MAG: ABC transporter ATP-binding protein [Bacillota bacterium]
MSQLAVETWMLSKEYRGHAAVSGVSLRVPRGSVFALLGPNGSGKSTLLKMIIGVTPPSAGGGLCLGYDLLVKGLQIRERTGYLGEEPRYYGYMTVRQILSFSKGFYPQWDDALVERAVAQFELPLKAKVHELSQGMKNQLGLITALAPRPELLVLDEPTTGFDPVKRRFFFTLLIEEAVSCSATVLIASHQLDEVERVADQVALIKQGRLLKTCSMDALLSGEKEIRVVFQKEPPPALLQTRGIGRVRREGQAYLISVTENLEGIWEACAAWPHYALETVGTGLEEIFLRYMEGGSDHDPSDPLK